MVHIMRGAKDERTVEQRTRLARNLDRSSKVVTFSSTKPLSIASRKSS